MPVHGIHDTAPATRWEDSFLSGNGETGVMVLGHPHHERIVHNHHRFVLPDPDANTTVPAVAAQLEHVRDLLLAGQPHQAQEAFSDGRTLDWTQAFHPGPVLHLRTPEAGTPADYRRTTDYTTGEIHVTWTDTAGPHLRRTFASRTARTVVTEISGAPIDLTARWSADVPGHPDSVTWTTSARTGTARTAELDFAAQYAGTGGYRAEAVLIVDGGSLHTHGDAVRITGADRVLILTRLHRTPAVPATPGPTAVALADLPTSYARLLEEHTAVHGALFARSHLELGTPTEAGSTYPGVADLLAAASGTLAPRLCEALYANGRYLLISATGVLPPRLTGLWLGAWGATWSGDFTTDANINLQVASLVSTGTPELLLSLADLIAAQIDDWRTNAATVYGARGILAPSRTDGEHGRLFHATAEWPWTMWTAGADWLLEPLVGYWHATGDDTFLRDTLAPWLIEAARFYEDFLSRRDAAGHLVLVPSFSPETGPAGTTALAGINATMDIAAARHALTTAADVCALLDLPEPSAARWRQLADSLPPYRIDEHGALAEWAWNGLDTDPDHRHISHLYPVWPLHEITPETTPALAAAARRALVARGDENLSAHGSLHRALCAARLRDPGLLTENLMKILGTDMLFRSLMTSHYPGRDVYNADAALTIPAAFAEALADGQPGLLHLLPAVPEAWRRGRAAGLLTGAGILIEELTWDLDHAAIKARLFSRSDVSLRVRGPQGTETQSLRLTAGQPQTVHFTWER